MSREHVLNFFKAVGTGPDGTVALEEAGGKLVKINGAPVGNLTREQLLRIFNRPGGNPSVKGGLPPAGAFVRRVTI